MLLHQDSSAVARPTVFAESETVEILRRERAALARRAVAGALTVGILADVLLRQGPVGIGFAIWILVLAGTVAVLAWRRDDLTREQAGWLGVAVLFAAGLAWRDAEPLQVFDFFAVFAISLLLFTTFTGARGRSVFTARVRDLVRGALQAIGSAVIGFVGLVFRDAAFGRRDRAPERNQGAHRVATIARAFALTLPLLVIFGSLFRAADPMFASLVSVPPLDFELVASHVLVAGFFTWIVGGWMRGAFLAEDTGDAPDGSPLVIGRVELTSVLGALVALFALFVVVQLGWLFGGAALVRRTTGLSIAEYARRGFFELVWVSVLVLPVLLGVQAMLPAGDASLRVRFRRLALPLLALLGAVMISALGRMALYVNLYGLSTDRIYATAVMVWLALVFVWFGVTVLRDRPKRFAGGMAATAFAVLASLNVANPDAIVARSHIARVQDGGTATRLDLGYIAGLGGEAMPSVVGAMVALPPLPETATDAERYERCSAATRILSRFGPDSRGESEHQRSWTQWNRGHAVGERAVRDRYAELAEMKCPVKKVEAPRAGS